MVVVVVAVVVIISIIQPYRNVGSSELLLYTNVTFMQGLGYFAVSSFDTTQVVPYGGE
jgi:hypothetical protein